MSPATLPAALAPAVDDTKLARDLAWVAADLMTIEEVASRHGVTVAAILARMGEPALLSAVDTESVKARLSGETGQAQAVRLRDKLLTYLGDRINSETPPRVLIDALNAVRHVAAQGTPGHQETGFSLNIVFSSARGAHAPSPVVINAETGREEGRPFTVNLPWLPDDDDDDKGGS